MATFTAPSLKKYQDIFNAEKARVDDPSIGRVFGPGSSGYESMLKNIAYYSPGGAGYVDELRDFELRQASSKASELGITAQQLVENPELATDPAALLKYKTISNPVIPKTLGALATPDTQSQVDAIAKQFADIQERMRKEGVTDASGNFLIKPISGTASSADLQSGTSGSTPQLPQNNTQSTQETTFASMQAQIDTLKKANEDANAQRAKENQSQIDAANAELTAARVGQNTAIQEEKQRALDALNEGNAVFRKAQQEYTALSDQMQTLLTQGQELIQQQKSQTGLASIMTPRINQTIADVTAQAGVIQSVLTAKYNGMAAAYGVLDATVKAVNVYKQDEINYYTSIQDAAKDELITLTSDQKKYLDYKITSLAADLKTAEANSEALKEKFLDPDTALKFAKAGITINTPQEQWGAKLATQDYAEELAKTSSDMAAKGYSTTPVAGYVPITLTDSRGKQKTWYGKPTASSGDTGNAYGWLDEAISLNPDASYGDIVANFRNTQGDALSDSELKNYLEARAVPTAKDMKRTKTDIELTGIIVDGYKNGSTREDLMVEIQRGTESSQSDKDRAIELVSELIPDDLNNWLKKVNSDPDKYEIKDDGIYELIRFWPDKRVYTF